MKTFSFLHYLRNKIKLQKGNTIIIGKNVGISGCTIIIKGQNNCLTIGDLSRLRNMTIEIVGNGCKIEIGERCVIGHGSYLSAKEENTHLLIGNNCMFSRNVNILTSDGHPIYQNNRRINPAQHIMIGHHVWLADNVTVLKGVTIGEGSVIGIHSLVTKSISHYAIAVGNPAREVKEEIHWEI
ncbi:MAG: acyltransferase [Sulfuricurvum sp.]|nr:acyltransferase [Sulfuricurvum sp.]